MKDPITLAIEAAGSGPKLAEQMAAAGDPLTARAIYQWRIRWMNGNLRAVPAQRAVQLERACGVPKHLFRPDLWAAPQDRAA
jgi:hypothetical protein